MTHKDFVGPGSYPIIHPAIDEEIDTTTHCQPLHSPIKSESIISQQRILPHCQNSQMLGEIYQYLKWELNVDPIMLREFKHMFYEDFVGSGPYPIV